MQEENCWIEFLASWLVFRWTSFLALIRDITVSDYERLIKWGIPSVLLIIGMIYLDKAKFIRVSPVLVALGI